jgi:outer membrane protein OmpA-like peptidoglycan-associated protein
MNKPSIFILFLVAVFIPLKGQQIIPTPADQYNDAMEYMLAGDYAEALPTLFLLKERGFTSANLSYMIGECYLNLAGQKTKAIPYLKEAADNISSKWTGNSLKEEFAPNKVMLYLGIAYRLNNDIDHALVSFNTYLNSLDDTDKNNRALVEDHITRCNNARELMITPGKFSTDTLPAVINNPVSNFNPVLSPDEKLMYYMNQLKFYDAVMRTVKVDNAWQPPENITPDIKSDGDHYVTGISADGKKLLLTYYDPYQVGDIYMIEQKDEKWGELVRQDSMINTQFNETHASFSPDGKTIYFTSDRKGGYGGLDIYCSQITSTGAWGEPKNLGPLVNTPYNEESPFISPDSKMLFFSSQGHYNMGGYDIFCSSLDANGSWLPPLNIGYPINTTDDDLFFFPVGNGNIAYNARFSAVSGQKDIIRYTIDSYGHPARFTVNGKIDLPADPGYNPEMITVAFISKNLGDTIAKNPLSNNGTFSQKLSSGNYNVNFSNEDGVLLNKELDIPDYFPQNNLVMREEIVLKTKTINDTLFVKDIRFDFDKSNLDKNCQDYLNEIAMLMVKYPELRLELKGYTDAIGNESYNFKLSGARVNSVMTYLQSTKDLQDRITSEAFGEKNPVTLNQNPDGSDNPSGRLYNRRVELVFTNIPNEMILVNFADIPEYLKVK